MSDSIQSQDLTISLTRTGQEVGRLAADDTLFRAAVDAFRAGDGESFSGLLDRFEIRPFCEEICRWFCSKECVLECIEFCGPPEAEITAEQIPQFADVIAKITGDEELVERLADAVQRRDASSFKALVTELKIEQFCHLLCHWACGVRCRLICEVLCEPRPVPEKEFVAALATAGDAIGRLAKNREQLQAVIAAGIALNCEVLRGILGEFDDCQWICEWICSWRCVLVCLPFCRPFPPLRDTSIEEMRGFAQLSARLAESKDAFPRLLAALQAQDAEAFSALVKEFEIEQYCLQLCHWLCSEICRLFCFCVCPPPDTIPLFTKVGIYSIFAADGEFQGDGTTTAGGYAFTRIIWLEGTMPSGDASKSYEYHFRIAKYPAVTPADAQDVLGAQIPPTVIGQLLYWDYDGANWNQMTEEYWVNNPGAQVTIHRKLQPDLVVDVNKNVKANGWIEVPRENDFTQGGGGKFVAGGGFAGTDMLARLDTTKFTNEVVDLSVPAPGLKAGDSLAAGVPPHSEMPTYRIFFEAREVGPGPTVSANDLTKIAFSNTTYTYVRHAEWDGGPVSTRTVCSLDIAEMIAPGATGCDEQHDHVHGLYTCYHPYLGSVLLWLQGPGIPTGLGIPPVPVPPAPFSFAPAIASGEAASGAAGHDFDISALQPCAYILWMSATVKLTEGDGLIPDPTDWDVIAFCKGQSPSARI